MRRAREGMLGVADAIRRHDPTACWHLRLRDGRPGFVRFLCVLLILRRGIQRGEKIGLNRVRRRLRERGEEIVRRLLGGGGWFGSRSFGSKAVLCVLRGSRGFLGGEEFLLGFRVGLGFRCGEAVLLGLLGGGLFSSEAICCFLGKPGLL